MEELSIVICSYNRKDLLKNALDSLLLPVEKYPKVEILVIDNNSTDGTIDFLNKYKAAHVGFPLKVIGEKQQGLSYSRNRGYIEAKGEYVAYIDDDAKISENWLDKCISIIRQIRPDIFGGAVYPYYIKPKEPWFKDEYGFHAVYDFIGWATEKIQLCGANMIFKGDILRKLGGFNTSLGMKGKEWAYGEETDLFIRARKNGVKIYYDKDLFVYHIVSEYKQNLMFQFLFRFETGQSQASININTKDGKDNLRNSQYLLYESIMDIYTKLKKMRSEGVDNQTELLDQLSDHISMLGYHSKIVQNRLTSKKSLSQKIYTTSLETIVEFFKSKIKN